MSGDDSAERSLSGGTQWFDCQGSAIAVALAWLESYSIECRMVNPEGFGLTTGTTQRAGGLSESKVATAAQSVSIRCDQHSTTADHGKPSPLHSVVNPVSAATDEAHARAEKTRTHARTRVYIAHALHVYTRGASSHTTPSHVWPQCITYPTPA